MIHVNGLVEEWCDFQSCMSIKSVDSDLVFSIPNRSEVFISFANYGRSVIQRKKLAAFFGIFAMQSSIV